jgi:hypothetical protein
MNYTALGTRQLKQFQVTSFLPSFFHSFIHPTIHSFINGSTVLSLGTGLFFSSVIIFTQSVGLLGRLMGPSQGRYLHTGQHKHTIDAQRDIHALSRIRTHDPSVRARDDSSCLIPRGHCNWHTKLLFQHIPRANAENYKKLVRTIGNPSHVRTHYLLHKNPVTTKLFRF